MISHGHTRTHTDILSADLADNIESSLHDKKAPQGDKLVVVQVAQQPVFMFLSVSVCVGPWLINSFEFKIQN